jgi:glucose/mannose-6-phosphate isomerase
MRNLQAQYDKFNMARVIEGLPDQIETVLAADIPRIESRTIDKVVLAGVGGSALAADIINDAFADKLRVPLRIDRYFTLPADVSKNTLFIISSGNTEEPLEVLEEARAVSDNIAVLTGGGKLYTLGMKGNYPTMRIPVEKEPEGFQPRSALGYSVTYLTRFLYENGLMENPLPELTAVPKFLRSLINIRADAEELAGKLVGKIPLVYTDELHQLSVARIAKIKFNENAKVPAFFNSLPEINHNEMLGFLARVSEFAAIYIHDPASHPSISVRYNIIQMAFKKKGIHNVDFHIWSMPGSNEAEKIFAALLFTDWCSYSLALLNKTDPTSVNFIEEFKKSLADKNTWKK